MPLFLPESISSGCRSRLLGEVQGARAADPTPPPGGRGGSGSRSPCGAGLSPGKRNISTGGAPRLPSAELCWPRLLPPTLPQGAAGPRAGAPSPAPGAGTQARVGTALCAACAGRSRSSRRPRMASPLLSQTGKLRHGAVGNLPCHTAGKSVQNRAHRRWCGDTARPCPRMCARKVGAWPLKGACWSPETQVRARGDLGGPEVLG